MRASRPTRARPAEFSLALPPLERLNEVQVQQKNELFINADDSIVSPMIIGNESLFPGVDTSNASGARFIHLNNTNLFVLMDGVSMCTDNKSLHPEDSSSHRVTEKVSLGCTPHNSSNNKNNTASVEDSVEAAIRDIECDSNFPLTSPITIFPNNCIRGEPVTVPCVPSGYAALFKNSANTEVGAFGLAPKSLLRRGGRCRGFVPFGISCAKMNNGVRAAKNTTIGDAAVVAPTPLAGNTYAKKTVSKPSDASAVFALFSPTAGAPNHRAQFPERSRETTAKTSVIQKERLISSNDIGMNNRSLDLDALETLAFIGRGSQGFVHRVRLDGKFFALKSVDVKEATESADAVERQGRKRGLVKELNMIRLQRARERPVHLMRMFNAVATLDNERQHLHILMELMSFSVEDIQCMVSRIPSAELMKLTQSTFRHFLAGTTQVQERMDTLLKQQSTSCMRLLGRKSFNAPEDWEMSIDRQTRVPEIVLSILASDVLKGLKELHESYRIVHCDLKPANLLLSYDRTCFKIADFGCGCRMDAETEVVRRLGVDLGSTQHKAPERLRGERADAARAADEADVPLVEFTAAADVWSLGIMLLELSNGANPCFSFKADFWNYLSNLKLSRMVKPLSWSAALCDFIVRCLVVNPAERWSVSKLLQHPFILKYSDVPRLKFKAFMDRLVVESKTFQKRQQREMLERQILLSTGVKASDAYKKESRTRWKRFTEFLSVAPGFQDEEKFPSLSAH